MSMNLTINKIDNFFIHIFENIVIFFNDFLGISKEVLEKIIIVLFSILYIFSLSPNNRFIDLIVFLVFLLSMGVSGTDEGAIKSRKQGVFIRIMIVYYTIVVGLGSILISNRYHWCHFFYLIVYISFLYISLITYNGEKYISLITYNGEKLLSNLSCKTAEGCA